MDKEEQMYLAKMCILFRLRSSVFFVGQSDGSGADITAHVTSHFGIGLDMERAFTTSLQLKCGVTQ